MGRNNDSPARAPSNTNITRLPAVRLNMSSIDGLRCLGTLSVILYHVCYVHGDFFYLSSSPYWQSFRSLPFIGPAFFNVSFHMTLFWAISGFLCEHQLNRMRDQAQQQGSALGWRDYACFVLNRFLRLYTLYFAHLLIKLAASDKCTKTEFFKSAFFIMDFAEGVPHCAGEGWSAMVDVHGYLVILACFIAVQSNSIRKYIMSALYGFSMLQVWQLSRQAPTQDLDGSVLSQLNRGGWLGLEYIGNLEKESMSHVMEVDAWSLHPTFNFEDPQVVAVQNWRTHLFQSTYFTSVFKHGSAMFLGSLLCMQLRDRKNVPSRCMSMLKLLLIPIMLESTDYHFAYSGLASYLVLEAALTTQTQLLANRFWAALAPYTYGVYMYHCTFIAIFAAPVFARNILHIQGGGNVDEPAIRFTLAFVMTKTLQVAVCAWILAFVLNRTLEWPLNYVRQTYVKGLLRKGKKVQMESSGGEKAK